MFHHGWTVATGVDNGIYDAITPIGTWAITLPVNQNYNGGLTFTPPADSDIDLTGLLSMRLRQCRQQMRLLKRRQQQAIEVIVDAVADMPTLTVNNANGLEGQTFHWMYLRH